MTGLRVAAIDVGTNTTRLLVAELHGKTLVDLDRRLIFSRLGEGVDATGRLNPRGIQATVAAITEFVGRARRMGAERIRIAGTSAVREAANGRDLLTAVKHGTGLDLEVVPGEAEAALSFAGATQDLPSGDYLVCDIGGGSTEFAVGRKAAGIARWAVVDGAISLKLGVVRLTERLLAHDPPTHRELQSLESDIADAMEEAHEALPRAGAATLVGVAGTITSLAMIKLGLDRYDPKDVHGSELTLDDVYDEYNRLARMPLHERAALPALPPGRADVIVAGCAILARAMSRWGFAAVRVSEKDILDGLAQDLI